MRKTGISFLYVLAGLLVSLPLAIIAQAETIACTAITSLPYSINTQGIYCLTGHLSTNLATGNAITVNVNNVILDLNGFKIGNLAAGPGTDANGVYALQRRNITVKNGTIRGFYRAIFLDDFPPYTVSQGHLVHDVRADTNHYIGMWLKGTGNIIRNSTVVETGGGPGSNHAFGIIVYGGGTVVKDNAVYETKEQSTGMAYGIYVYAGDNTVVWNNTIGNGAPGTGTSTGIDIYSSDNVLVRSNNLTSIDRGVYFESGGTGSTGKFRDNLTGGCTTPYSGGTDAGGND